MLRHWHTMMVFPLFLFLFAGCTTAGDYKQPITAFGAATKVAQTSLEDYSRTLATAFVEEDIQKILARTSDLTRLGGDCIGNAQRCRLVVRTMVAGQFVEHELTPVFVADRIMAGVVTYADNLGAIAAVDAQKDIKTRVDEAMANLGVLAKDVDSLTGNRANLSATISPFLTPIGQAIGFALGAYVDRQKIEALRQTTSAMDSIFPSLTLLFSASADAVVTTRRVELQRAYNAADQAFVSEQTRSRMSLDAVRSAAAAYDRALAINPAAPFVALEQAHAALNRALNDPNPSFDTALAQAQRVAAEARRVATIIAAFESASK